MFQVSFSPESKLERSYFVIIFSVYKSRLPGESANLQSETVF